LTSLPPRNFYGWRLLAAAGAIQLMLGALLTQSFGLYVAVIGQEMGWSKATLSGAAALQSVESALIGPVLGWLLDRVGAQIVVRWGLVIFGAGLMLMSQVDSVWLFYVAAVLMAVGASLGGYFALSVTIVHWFQAHRARALSALSVGLAGGGLVVPLIAASMQHHGWRATALGSGAFVIVVGWALARVIRGRPEDVGERVDGAPPAPLPVDPGADASRFNVAPLTPTPPPEPAFTAGQALRTRAFWLLATGHGLALLVVTAINVHAVSHMTQGVGISVTDAGWVITMMTVAQLGGVLLGVVAGDRFDKRHVTAACMFAHAAGLLCLTWSTQMGHLLAFAVLHGLAWGLRGPLMQAMRADYFGRRAIGMILGLSATIVAVGQVCGPMIAGLMADLTGDYRAGFTGIALLALAGSWAFLQAHRPTPGKDAG
jgi:MFS family permease